MSAQRSADPAAALAPPPKLRRRPLLVALGVLLIVVSALVAWYVVGLVKDTVQVVAALNPIPRGTVIAQADLTTVEIRPDPLLHTVPAAGLDGLVGQRAAADIPAGVIVAPEAVTADLLPAAGQAIVGVALTASQRPATPPRHGQPITLVSTPRANEDTALATEPTEIAAIVVAITEYPEQNLTVLDVTVPKSDAAAVAALVATGRVAAYWDAE
ncbi:MAG: SAF domain-containing protein [Propionibacteriaceae bacterium]|jgi:hypothetical protein|nr:SAF domain-containing protein [Propionibacteriaceae bacterium]